MDIILKPYEDDRKETIKKLFETTLEGDRLQAIFNSSKRTLAYLAYHKQEVVGLLFGWKRNFHPYCTNFRILTKPLYTTEKVKEKCLEKLLEANQRGDTLKTSVLEVAITSRDFYERRGFYEQGRTFMPRLDIETIEDPLTFYEAKRKKVKTFTEIASHKEKVNRLAMLTKEKYEKENRGNPLGNISLQEWKQLIFSDDLIEEGSFALIDGEENIIAYSFLHQSDQDKTFVLGWLGSSDQERKGALPLLVSQQIYYAREQRAKYIVGEFDTLDPFAQEVMRVFTFKPFPSWITYIK